MKSKRISTFMLVVVLSLTFPVQMVRAEDTEKNATSDVSISFVENDSVTPPVDPTDPSQPGTGTGTNMNGPLSIDYVSPLNFGSNLVISSSEENYNTTVAIPYIQVSDLRGSSAGWNVTAVCSSFKKDGTETASLNGAEIILTGASVLSANTELAAPVPNDSVTLRADGNAAKSTATIITAASGAGQGTWVNRWYNPSQPDENKNVKLKVPAGAATTGGHTAVITWTLSDAPS